MKKCKRIALSFVCAVLFLSGCLGQDASVYGKQKVLQYVDSVCPEPYQLEGSALIQEDPDNMEYYFRTDRRELEFKANSYLSPVWIDGTKTSFYTREISCDYVEQVRQLYREEVKAVLKENDHYLEDHGWMYLSSFDDLEPVVETILEADKVYARELDYNSEEFLKKNPVASVHFVWQPSREAALAHEDWVNITDVGVTGQHDRQVLYDDLANTYAQLCVDGKIPEIEDVPDKYLEDKHVSMLSEIWLNDTEMLYDSNDNPYGPFGLTTDDYKYCWYSSQQESYMMVIDTGLVTDNMSIPLIIREYVHALGGTYDVSGREHAYTSQWTIGSDTWVMKSVHSNDGVQSLKFWKNGSPLDISYITVDEDTNVAATFCAGISVKDFCRLFDLSFEISESERRISFYKS